MNTPTKAKRKATLKAFRTAKKLKYMDDPLVAKEARITALRDHWLIARGKPTPETKAQIKKAADAEKKLVEKLDKVRKKARAKNQTMDIRRLALSNSRTMEIGAFIEILSDPQTRSEPQDAESSHAHTCTTLSPSNEPNQRLSPNSSKNPVDVLTSARLSINQKKKATQLTLVDRLNGKPSSRRARTPTPLPIAMELIRPGKRKVRVTAIAVENTPSKKMRQAKK